MRVRKAWTQLDSGDMTGMMPSSGGVGPGAASIRARRLGLVVVIEGGGLVFGFMIL